MSNTYYEYPLTNGYIDHWLVAGPRALEVIDLERFSGADYKLQIARHYHDPMPGIEQPPIEWQQLTGEAHQGNKPLRWEYSGCGDDHFVDLTAFYHLCHHLRAWAYAELTGVQAGAAAFTLTVNGPADVWINGEHVHGRMSFHHQIPHSTQFEAQLRDGTNTILVRFEGVAARECPYAMALHVACEQSDLAPPTIRLPAATTLVARRKILERLFAQAYIEQPVYDRDGEIAVCWPDTMTIAGSLVVRFQTPSGQIFLEGQPDVRAGTRQVIGRGAQYKDGVYQVVLMPKPEEYYEHHLRLTRTLPLTVLKNRYSNQPYGTYEERRQEALLDAAGREQNIFAEIAKMELGRWTDVDLSVLAASIDGISRRKDCSDFYLVGLLGMLDRYGEQAQFPPELRESLTACALGFRYWMDEPGEDAMCFWSENHQILFHACEILAGQLFPDAHFSNTGTSGHWHREKGERMALSWLQKRATGGFREWDSNGYFEHDVLALTHLADLAENDAVRELAAVILDKLFFTMAVNSFRGAFGSTHGRTYTPFIKGARLEHTAGLGRMLWGMGVFNAHILGTVSLACAQGYELPPIIASIAADQIEELWSRERHAGTLEEWCDRASGDWEVNKVTYKTPHGMLCSAQDYQPGTPGYQQHIWQATLSHDAVVFVTHPPCISEDGSHRPNYWHGNVILPRVAQWYDTLVAVHTLPEGDWTNYTHAYFPTYAFDEYVLRDGWAFARVGDGYLALTASSGLELVTNGNNAYAELRSQGPQTIWLCHMGRAARDQDFSTFQKRILELETTFEGLQIECETPRGSRLAFGWEGPLVVDGIEQPLSGFKHYDNYYAITEHGDQEMVIVYGEDGLRLHFAAQG